MRNEGYLSKELNTIRLVSPFICPNAANPPAISGEAFPRTTRVTPARVSFMPIIAAIHCTLTDSEVFHKLWLTKYDSYYVSHIIKEWSKKIWASFYRDEKFISSEGLVEIHFRRLNISHCRYKYKHCKLMKSDISGATIRAWWVFFFLSLGVFLSPLPRVDLKDESSSFFEATCMPR